MTDFSPEVESLLDGLSTVPGDTAEFRRAVSIAGDLIGPDPEDASDDYVHGLVNFLCDFFGHGSDSYEDVRSVLEAQARTAG